MNGPDPSKPTIDSPSRNRHSGAGICPLLTVSDVAQLLSISQSCVRTLARCGELRGIKITSDWRFRREAVEELLRAKETAYYGDQAG